MDDCKPIASECKQDPVAYTVAGLAVQCRQTHDPRSERPGLSCQNSEVMVRTCDLGVVVDSRLTMADHIASVCRAAYYQLRQIRPMVNAL